MKIYIVLSISGEIAGVYSDKVIAQMVADALNQKNQQAPEWGVYTEYISERIPYWVAQFMDNEK